MVLHGVVRHKQIVYRLLYAAATLMLLTIARSAQNNSSTSSSQATGSSPQPRRLQLTPPTTGTSSTIALCNGHANLCGKRVNEIVFATVHNANNALLDGAYVLPNHKLDLVEALQAGYRGINMDFGKCMDDVTLLHVTCLLKTGVPLVAILQDVSNFLDANPNEVIVLPTEITTDVVFGGAPSLQEIDQVFRSVAGFHEKLYDHPSGDPWPTLQDLIDSNQRILFFFYGETTCTPGVDCPVGFHP